MIFLSRSRSFLQSSPFTLPTDLKKAPAFAIRYSTLAGMGHTASIHTRDRNAALHYGALMPAARVVVNTPSTHGAIGFSTALAPSMTLGCGSWGGNVTSDNISPLHLHGYQAGTHSRSDPSRRRASPVRALQSRRRWLEVRRSSSQCRRQRQRQCRSPHDPRCELSTELQSQPS